MINQIKKHPRLAAFAAFVVGYQIGRNNWDLKVSLKREVK